MLRGTLLRRASTVRVSAAHFGLRPCACAAYSAQPSPPVGGEQALSRAARLLSGRLRSKAELVDKLTGDEQRGFSSAAVAYAAARCEELRLLDDAAFASQLAAHKWRTASWSAGRIRGALRVHKVPQAEAEAALATLFGPGGEACTGTGDDEEAGDAALLKAARRQWKLSRGADAQARLRRLQGWLARRGHTWSTVRAVSDALLSEQAAEQAEQAAELDGGECSDE
jgi:SOS response regulatory protein OraA/RecX